MNYSYEEICDDFEIEKDYLDKSGITYFYYWVKGVEKNTKLYLSYYQLAVNTKRMFPDLDLNLVVYNIDEFFNQAELIMKDTAKS
jgi:hypothetical protein